MNGVHVPDEDLDRHMAAMVEALLELSNDYLPRDVRRGWRKETPEDRQTAIKRAAKSLKLEPTKH